MPSQIFKATYSGVPVYEMISEGVSVMRRRADGWLNATQILKVAGFDKPQRTRVLEREVQKGVHEKVQGGYGKYQGTWVPPESALAIARQYEVEAQLRPIIDYEPSSNSPPPAPKHTVASNSLVPPTVKASRHRSPSGYSSTRTRSARQPSVSQDSPSDLGMFSQDDNTSEPSTPSPVASVTTISVDGHERDLPTQSPRKNQPDSLETEASFADIMLDYFMSEDAQTPEILVHPPPDLDVNVTIDEDDHSSLHWAAAMCRIRVVKLLISAGADIAQSNKRGQTPLMRAVMFQNTYEQRKFAELYELLLGTTLNIDLQNRTVLHHISDLALTKGKLHAARYYMEAALIRFADFPTELVNVINYKDKDGETALTMAARCRSKRLVKVLLDNGANPHIKNGDGKSAEDYVADDERFHDSPTIASRTLFRIGALDPKTQASLAVRRAGDEAYNNITANFDELLFCLDTEFKTREKDISQASGILAELEREVESTQKAIDELKQKSGEGLEAKKALLVQAESENKARVAHRSKTGMLQWLHEETERETSLWNSGRGITKATIASTAPDVLRGSSTDEDVSDLAKLYSDVPQSTEEYNQMCASLRGELNVLMQQTRVMVDAYTNTGTAHGGKVHTYEQLLLKLWPTDKGQIDWSELSDLQKMMQPS